MMKKGKPLLIQVKEKAKGPFIKIFGSNMLSLFMSFLVSVLVVRQLNKEAYGTYSVANNLYSYFALLSGIGLTNGILQFCAEKRPDGEKHSIYDFGFKVGMGFNVLLGLVIIGFALIDPGSSGKESQYLMLMAGIPLTAFASNFFSTRARINSKFNHYAIAHVASAVAHFVVTLVATKLFSIYGLIVSTYLQNISSIAVYVFFLLREEKNTCRKGKLDPALKKEILTYSLMCCITTITSTLLSLLDITCIDRIVGNPEIIATYKVALMIPNALLVIPTSYAVIVHPLFARNNHSPHNLRKLAKQSVLRLGAINLAVCVPLFLLCDKVVLLLWGAQYMDVAPVLRILIVNYFLCGTFRKLFGTLLGAIKKVKINLLNTAIGGVVNILLNIVLILKFGAIGAAIATLLTTITISIIPLIYLTCVLREKPVEA